jgi:hypothetical protein
VVNEVTTDAVAPTGLIRLFPQAPLRHSRASDVRSAHPGRGRSSLHVLCLEDEILQVIDERLWLQVKVFGGHDVASFF